MTKTPISTLSVNFTDPQKYKIDTKVTRSGRTGTIWSYISNSIADENGKHLHWDRKYRVRYDDKTIGEHSEEELQPL